MRRAVIEFITLAWENAGGDPHSWTEYNHRVRTTCHIAAAGFMWQQGDMDALLHLRNRRYTITKCLGEDGVEYLYATAVLAANMTACVELERFMGRVPLIADSANNRNRDRLCVGSEFAYDCRRVRVTSFRHDGRAVCVPVKPVADRPKIYKISRQDIIDDRKRASSQPEPSGS